MTDTPCAEERAFLSRLVLDPADTTAALVFCDWLDDRGRPEAAWLRPHLVSTRRWPAAAHFVRKTTQAMRFTQNLYRIMRGDTWWPSFQLFVVDRTPGAAAWLARQPLRWAEVVAADAQYCVRGARSALLFPDAWPAGGWPDVVYAPAADVFWRHAAADGRPPREPGELFHAVAGSRRAYWTFYLNALAIHRRGE